jgi:uncharacterized membrane protein
MKISFNKYPVDIVVLITLNIILIPIILLNLNDTLKIILGLPFLLFIPGYLLLFVLFPTKKTEKGIDFTKRIALSFGLSLAIIPLIGIALYYITGGIQSESAFISIFIFEISLGLISTYRWYKTTPDERLILSINLSLDKFKKKYKTKTKLDKILLITIIILLILTTTLFIFVITTPRPNEKFTSFNILGSDKSTTNYPYNVISGENTTIIIGITNHEYQTINYTIEVWLINQTIKFNESAKENIISYNNAWFMDKINTRLIHYNKKIEKEWKTQWNYNYTFNITKKGENLTLAFLLFTTPTENYDYDKDYKDIIKQKIDNSYEELHIWINVK